MICDRAVKEAKKAFVEFLPKMNDELDRIKMTRSLSNLSLSSPQNRSMSASVSSNSGDTNTTD